jgi:SAM-dependent methyltransferase
MTLQEIWNDMPLKSDKGDVHDYISVYEKILAPYRDMAKNVLEIGLFNGASLLMWEKYFSGKVYGIDCSDQPHGGMADLRPLIAEGTHNIFIGDAENELEVEAFFKDIKFDVVIEDAGHHVLQQLNIYKIIKPYLNKGSLYIIEDIQNIEETRNIFQRIDFEKEVEVVDRRHVNGRYDDVMVIIKDKQ